MTELLVVIVTALMVIAGAAVLGPRLGVAAPLVLVAIGVGASFLPVFGSAHIEAGWILEGVLPPLLYSSAVSMPAMNFRREFGAISGLSVLLVVASALLLGVFFMLAVPELGFAWGVALGAIVSPTDAVATSIIKQTSVSQRVVALLDGESISFTVPFLAAVPATLLDASGLVAAVVAGLVTGIRAPRDLSPQNRLSDAQNWHTVELVLEGAVFLTMGIQIKGRLEDERNRIFELLRTSAGSVPGPPSDERDFAAARDHRLAVIAAQRAALLDARDHGTFDADVLTNTLANLDASQIDLELRNRLAA